MGAHLTTDYLSRHTKLLRREECDQIPIEMSSQNKKVGLYFDVLDDNGLDHVAKCMRSKECPSYCRAADIIQFFDVRSALGCFLRNRCFTMLVIGREPSTLGTDKKGVIWAEDIKIALEYVQRAGQSLRAIDLNPAEEDMKLWNREGLVVQFSRNCPNVRFLKVSKGGTEI